LYTFGFPFRPWTENYAIAEASVILKYLEDTVKEPGIIDHIQFGHRMNSANWSSKHQQWQLSIDSKKSGKKSMTCQFLFLCTGYYDYENPLPVSIPGLSSFDGKTVHPQFWPSDLDYADKNIVIVGSGATAVTLLPNLCKTAKSVVMLQRSPSYIISLPQSSAIGRFVRRYFPTIISYYINRALSLFQSRLSFVLFQRFPSWARSTLRGRAASQLPPNYALDPDFAPSYNPWDQRLCISPSGDFYKAIRDGKGSIITSAIDHITSNSIHLVNYPDKILKPDIIITATGLKIQVAGGSLLTINGQNVNPESRFVYRHTLLQDIPNLALFIGHANQSWTLGADTTALYLCRMIKMMRRKGWTTATPKPKDKDMKVLPLLSLSSSYLKNSRQVFPAVSDKKPWQARSWYVYDWIEAMFCGWEDLEFGTGIDKNIEDKKDI